MNKGLIRGFGDRYASVPFDTWIPYGPQAGESYPLVDASVTTPSFGSGGWQTARYCVIPPGIVIGFGQAFWGSGGNAGSGIYRVLLPPVGVPSRVGVAAGETIGWVELAGDTFAITHMEQCSLTWGGAGQVPSTRIPADRYAVINVHPYSSRGSSPGTSASMATFGAENIAHGLGDTPDIVVITETRASGTPPIELTVTAKDATNFTVALNAIGDRTGIGDGSTTNGSTTITSPTIRFVKSDIGKFVTGTGIPANTKITAVANIQSATISTAATATSSTVAFTIVSNSTSAPIGYSYDWQAWAPRNGVNGGGLWVTHQWPWNWGTQGMGIEWRFQYPIAGTQ